MGTHRRKEPPDVRHEENNAGYDEEGSFTPNVGARSGEESGESNPESQESDDQTRNHIQADIVFHRDDLYAWRHHWAQSNAVSC